MKNTLIGRLKEQEILAEALQSTDAEMVSVIGRRRVGKTFLINKVYKDNISFEVSGIQNAPKDEQLMNFIIRLAQFSPETAIIKPPTETTFVFK